MEILLLATATYADPFALEWQPDLRLTASFLRRHGVDAGFVYLPVLDGRAPVLEQLRLAAPTALFLDLTEETLAPGLRLLRAARVALPRTHVIVGGIPPTLSTGELLEQHPEVDLVVVGERELTLLETLARLKEGASLGGVLGLRSRQVQNPPRPLIDDLDVLGGMIDDGLAEMLGGTAVEERAGFLVGSRGCYGRCSFCGVPGFYRTSRGKPWRGRSPRVVVDELQRLSEAFELRQFVFQDDNFIGPGRAGQERVRAIAREILHRGLQIRYSICCRLDDVRSDTIQLLQESGLSGLGVSVESGNQASLDLLRKGMRVGVIHPTLALLEELEVPSEVNLIFFDPLITLEGVRRNLALLEYVRRSEYLSYSTAFPFNELRPFSWSPVARSLRAKGLLDEASGACRYADPAVARLVEFVRRLREHTPLRFKKTLLFNALASLERTAAARSGPDALIRLCAGLRHWVGLTLLPRTVAEACDILEARGDGAGEKLDALEARFRADAAVLHEMERKLRDALAPADPSEPLDRAVRREAETRPVLP
jgi:anaerobic magnesium-protoporphyrin IX monomethyl ester cyclase